MPRKTPPEATGERPPEPFFFPEHGVTLLAASLAEAEAKLGQLLAPSPTPLE